MENTEKIVEMLKNIDSHFNRIMPKVCLGYDKNTLSEIIKKGYVTVKGDFISREFHGKNYQVYA
jgi:hypothetical protein